MSVIESFTQTISSKTMIHSGNKLKSKLLYINIYWTVIVLKQYHIRNRDVSFVYKESNKLKGERVFIQVALFPVNVQDFQLISHYTVGK